MESRVVDLLERRPSTASSSHGRPDALSDFEFNPEDYDPAEVAPDTRVGDDPDVINLWAPSFDADGRPNLGFMLAGFPSGPFCNRTPTRCSDSPAPSAGSRLSDGHVWQRLAAMTKEPG